MNPNFKTNISIKNFELAIKQGDLNPLKQDIIKHLNVLASNHLLSPVVYSENHTTNFSKAWNNLVEQSIDNHNSPSIKYFVEKLIIYQLGASLNTNNYNTETLNKSYDTFIQSLNKGDFNTYETPEENCWHCGEKLPIKFKNWMPVFYEIKEINNLEDNPNKEPKNSSIRFLNKKGYFPAEKCFNEFIQIKDVEFKTGNLIITDWIRLEEFTKNIEPNGNIYHFDLSSSKGRYESFEHYFKQNVISIHSYGLDMHMLKNKEMNNSFVFGQTDYNINGNFKQLDYVQKSINQELRATTIIEKETLIEIVNRTINNLNQSTEIINNYIKQNQQDLIEEKIKKGTYTLIFDLNKKDLNDLLFPHNIPHNIKPNIFLFPKNLTPSLSKKQKNNIK